MGHKSYSQFFCRKKNGLEKFWQQRNGHKFLWVTNLIANFFAERKTVWKNFGSNEGHKFLWVTNLIAIIFAGRKTVWKNFGSNELAKKILRVIFTFRGKKRK